MMKDQNLVDHYQVLGVPENATYEEIRTAYRQMVLLHHPDRNLDDTVGAHRKTVEINLAYEILTNVKHRSNYDKVRSYSRRSSSGAGDTAQQREYAEARQRYQESESEARERVRKWFYERLGVRPTKRHSCYTPQGNGTALDNLVTKIDSRLGDKVWEYRITAVPDSPDKMKYRIRIVCDPSKCGFRVQHLKWVEGYYYGLFKAGTAEDVEHNIQLAYTLLGDILEGAVNSHRITVFYGIVNDLDAPWRCYLNLSVVLIISAFDVFWEANIQGLTKFAKENKVDVAITFNELAKNLEICPVDLWRSQELRKDIARRAENILRDRRGMRKLNKRQT